MILLIAHDPLGQGDTTEFAMKTLLIVSPEPYGHEGSSCRNARATMFLFSAALL